jgi:hypothetical protein
MLNPLHPALQLVAAQPQLLLDHVGAYADWLGAEVHRATSQWRLRLILGAVALACLVVAVVLLGVAVMLAAMLPLPSTEARWVLLATPLLPLLVALGCGLALRPKPQDRIFDNLKAQIRADVVLFREASAP